MLIWVEHKKFFLTSGLFLGLARILKLSCFSLAFQLIKNKNKINKGAGRTAWMPRPQRGVFRYFRHACAFIVCINDYRFSRVDGMS